MPFPAAIKKNILSFQHSKNPASSWHFSCLFFYSLTFSIVLSQSHLQNCFNCCTRLVFTAFTSLYHGSVDIIFIFRKLLKPSTFMPGVRALFHLPTRQRPNRTGNRLTICTVWCRLVNSFST